MKNAIGGLALGRRGFIGGGAAFFAAAGMGHRAFGGAGGARLRVGILSDIHIVNTKGSCDDFEKALKYFRGRKVDAVLIAGDIVDNGLESQMVRVGDTWRRVFPGNRRPDGERVEKIFVTGNHDVEGWTYGYAKRLGITRENHASEILSMHMAESWRRIFDEEYSPIYIKDVKGYKFVGVHYDEFSKKGAVAAFLEAHRSELAGDRPFFYTQHYHPKGTCSAPWTWGQDAGLSTAALCAFPNAVAFTGHSHTPLTDDRTLWRGAFTSVGTASLRYLIPFGGRENSRIFGAKDVGTQQMPPLKCADGHHGQLMTVYDDRLVLERRDFENDLPAGPDWIVPLPARPETFAARAKKCAAPEFPAGANVKIGRVSGVNRAGKSVEQIAVTFPNVLGVMGGARAFDFEITVEAEDVDRAKTWMTKRVYSPHFYWAPEKDDLEVTCLFALSELPRANGRLETRRGRRFRFAVSPANCHGAQGRPIRSKWITGDFGEKKAVAK
jgi:predicted phosphodiesterase